MNSKTNKRAISTVVSMSLFLIITIISVSSLQVWLQGFESEIFSTNKNSDNSLRILGIYGGELYVNGESRVDILIENKLCITDIELNKEITQIPIDDCIENLEGTIDILMKTQNSIIKESIYLKEESFNSLNCENIPFGEWVKVPGNPQLNTQTFCVMKYEAKATASSSPNLYNSANQYCGYSIASGINCPIDGSVNITSKAQEKPLSFINQTEARSLCQNLGEGYDLISDAQWTTLGRNIESNSANWFNNDIYQSFIYLGHTDGGSSGLINNDVTIAASTNDLDPYYLTGDSEVSCDGSNNNFISGEDSITGMGCIGQKRTHITTLGQTIWDLSGNAAEWTRDIVQTGDKTTLGNTGGGFKEWVNTTNSTNLTSINYLTLNSTNGIGKVLVDVNDPYPSSDAPRHVLMRGGRFDRGDEAGIFNLMMHVGPSNRYLDTGFRCTYTR